MNIEELSKSQLVLLTILVNFVVSVATGIITVSFLDSAPAYVTQTINRVVERTIETVAQATPSSILSAPAPSTQDLVTSALGADATRISLIYAAGAGTSSPPAAIGTFLPKTRVVATLTQATLPKEALIGFPGNIYIPATFDREGGGIALYRFADDAALPKVAALALVPAAELKLGETALAIGADGSASTGIVARVGADGIYTTLPDIGMGSAAVNLAGNLIGLASGGTPGLLVSADRIGELIDAKPNP